MVLVAEGVGVLLLQGVVGFLQKEEVVALQEGVLEQQEQAEQVVQAVILVEVVQLVQLVQEGEVVLVLAQEGVLVVLVCQEGLVVVLQESLA